jgi:hypothetical protein
MQSQVLDNPGTLAQLDVSRLETGLYFLVLRQNNGEKKTLTFMKQ